MKIQPHYLLLFPFLFFTACLPVNHHMYGGEVLAKDQDEGVWAISYPNTYYTIQESPNNSCTDSSKSCYFQWQQIPSISRSWRTGLLDSLWIFPGLEMGYTLEIPMTLELGMRLALPSSEPQFKHAIGMGWDVGYWVDNTLWTEYGISYLPSQDFSLTFLNRVMWLSTQVGDLNTDGNDILSSHHQTFRLQTVLGFKYERLHFQIANDWLALPFLSSPSASALGRSEPFGFHPAFILGVTW